jgi:hypothetical protein
MRLVTHRPGKTIGCADKAHIFSLVDQIKTPQLCSVGEDKTVGDRKQEIPPTSTPPSAAQQKTNIFLFAEDQKQKISRFFLRQAVFNLLNMDIRKFREDSLFLVRLISKGSAQLLGIKQGNPSKCQYDADYKQSPTC